LAGRIPPSGWLNHWHASDNDLVIHVKYYPGQMSDESLMPRPESHLVKVNHNVLALATAASQGGG
jgi:hypothetical protein